MRNRISDAALRSALAELDRKLHARFGRGYRRLILFGSRATGDNRPDSDADVTDGPLPTELGRAMNEAQELRVEGDYGAGTPVASEVAAYVLKAEQFVTAVRGIVSGAVSLSAR